MRILFVCTANICRSPFMEVYARSRVGSTLQLASAGTHGFVDQPMSQEMTVELGARGLKHHDFRSRALTRAMVVEADLILTAESMHRRFVLDERPDAFRKTFTLGQAVRAADGLPANLSPGDALLELGQRRGQAAPELDIPDPYGRGAVAASAAAERISGMLDALLPVLGGASAEKQEREHG